MERLTKYHGGVAVIKDKARLKEAMAKLSAYEETGLEPQEVSRLVQALKLIDVIIKRL